MVRIVDEISNFLTLNGINLTDVDAFFETDTDRLMLKEEPSSARETRYWDGSRSGEFLFSLNAKNSSLVDAVDVLTNAEKILDIPTYFQINKFSLKTIEIVQSAHPIKRDEKNNLIYASDFRLTYYLDKED